jgi:hypothetical protein
VGETAGRFRARNRAPSRAFNGGSTARGGPTAQRATPERITARIAADLAGVTTGAERVTPGPAGEGRELAPGDSAACGRQGFRI